MRSNSHRPIGGSNEFFAGIGAIIEGRRTYDIEVRNGWENAHPVPTFIAAVVARAKQVTGKDIWIVGGAHVAQQFLDRGLIDRMIISIVPVVLGEGVRLFGRTSAPVELEFQGTRTLEEGLVQITYGRVEGTG